MVMTALACDKIDQPLQNELGFIKLPDSTNKVVLLEEFTGADCNNCPKAAEKAQDYLASFPGRVVVLSIHESNFAVPDAEHPIDYRVPSGTELYQFFSPIGVPSGMFDRKGYPDDEHSKLIGDWDDAMVEALKDTALLEITSDFEYDDVTDEFSLRVNVRALENIADADLYLSTFLIEDSIVSPQTLPNGSIKDDYVHMHMLRASFEGGGFGDQIAPNSMNDEQIITRNYSLARDAKWNPDHCSAVVFVYNRNTYEVLQAHHAGGHH